MNCRPGDLAIVVNDLDHPINNGCLLEIICRAPVGAFSIPADWVGRPLSTFDFGGRRNSPGDGRTVVYRDCELRPLRDSDGEDESLTWAEVPRNEESLTARGQATTATRQTCALRATIKHVEQLATSSWSLSLSSGNLGFNVKVDDAVLPPSGIKCGDQIRLEYKKGDHPFFGPFIRVCVLDE